MDGEWGRAGEVRKWGCGSGFAATISAYTIGFYRKERFERDLDEKDAPDYVMGFFQEEMRDGVRSFGQVAGAGKNIRMKRKVIQFIRIYRFDVQFQELG